MQFLLDYPPEALVAAGGILGLIIGSFLNVVILRLPALLEFRWQSEAREILAMDGDGRATTPAAAPPGLVIERSHCPKCNIMIAAYDNIPVVSYLLLRGRCRACDAPISIQYPAVELLTCIASGLCIFRFGVTTEGLAALLLTWTLIALSGIDFRTQFLPDDLTLPLLWLGLVYSALGGFATPVNAILGATVGYLSLWSVFWIFKLLTGKDGMGYGDFKLLAALGAWLGATSILPIILLSTVAGAVVGSALLFFQGRDRQIPMPFGPFLSIAGFVYLIFGESLGRWIPLLAV